MKNAADYEKFLEEQGIKDPEQRQTLLVLANMAYMHSQKQPLFCDKILATKEGFVVENGKIQKER